MNEFNEMNLSQEQERAVETMLSGRNVFLTGKAGTGKSTVIQAFKQRCNRQLVCLAPTGIAALNIQGSTIHRFFGLPSIINEYTCQNSANQKHMVFARVDTLLIDEISMVRSDVFAAMDTILRMAATGINRSLPFGGKQIITIGDFSQLPPVVSDWQIDAFLEATHRGCFAFSTQSWRNAAFQVMALTETFRLQDRSLLNIANAVRSGTADRSINNIIGAPTPLDYLNERHLPINNLSDATVCLCSHRRIADQINMAVIDQLPDNGMRLTGNVVGEFHSEDLPTYRNMVIKVGMRVMLLANKTGRETPFDYVNGTVGRVVDYGNDYGRPFVTVRLDDGKHVTVNSHTWSNYSYELYQDGSGNLELRQQEIGTFSQLPIIPSYGITLHKSQGMTIDTPVCLMLDDRPCFVSGQLYVALTRCRRLNQITLNRPVSGLDCPMNEEVQWFYQDYNLE